MNIIHMKTINTYINEKLRLTKTQKYTCQPKDKKELQQIIMQRIKDEGPTCDLNDIDVSKITDMGCLFNAGVTSGNPLFKDFNGDISLWNVSNVERMNGMFYACTEFDCDLSNWNVSNVEDMFSMFGWCKKFNCDISKWNVSNVEDMSHMFIECEKFNQDLNSWNVSNVKDMKFAFYRCPTQPTWYDKDKWEQ